MKSLTLFILIFNAVFTCNAQKNRNIPSVKHEIGVTILSFESLRINKLDLYNRMKVDFTLPSGIFYKRHYGIHHLRAVLNVSTDKVNEERYSDTQYIQKKGRRNQIGLHLGYERSFLKGNFQPYIGISAGYRLLREIGIGTNWGCLGGCFNQPYDLTIGQAEIQLPFGFKYEFAPRFSLTVESALAIMHRQNFSLGYNYTEFNVQLHPLNMLGLSYRL